ncbi:hypothetical protein FOZ62_012762 [Perkinsus olseni]|uniref:Uncharacterized protein n=1 Tax=Perkinsus olseni TaxID=32597 RepID=A0A7J6U200_PEROL|nr:hypothetical protein FOZ62_012762 [Perkinsus olseni]
MDDHPGAHSISLLSRGQQLVLFACCVFFSASLVVLHRITRSERQWRLKEYEMVPIKDSEELREGSTETRRSTDSPAKARYPFIDFLRGLCISFVVAFHLLFLCRESNLLPLDTWVDKTVGLPLLDYAKFILYFIVTFVLGYGGYLITPYMAYIMLLDSRSQTTEPTKIR